MVGRNANWSEETVQQRGHIFKRTDSIRRLMDGTKKTDTHKLTNTQTRQTQRHNQQHQAQGTGIDSPCELLEETQD